jgi:hypothetical protein
MYVRVLKNYLSLTIIKSISIDSKAILLLVIVPVTALLQPVGGLL